MSKIKFFRLFGLLIIALTFAFCESDPETETPSGDFPTNFTVDIPSSISQSTSLKSAGEDDFSGKEIYQHLNGFINLGESAADVEDEKTINRARINPSIPAVLCIVGASVCVNARFARQWMQ